MAVAGMREGTEKLVGFKALIVLSVFLLAGLSRPPPAEYIEPEFFQINTGSLSGTYYPIGEMLAAILSHPGGSVTCRQDRICGPEGTIAVASASEGSVTNVEEVEIAFVESGLAQADVVSRAVQGIWPFHKTGPHKNIRVIANLYPENVHVVVRRDLEISSIEELAGKRVSIDRDNSGTNQNARLILRAFGVDVNSIDLHEKDPGTSADMLRTGELDAFFFIGGAPLRVVTDLAHGGFVDLLEISGEGASKLVGDYAYFQPGRIPEGTYVGIAPVDTIAVGALWIVNKDVDEATVYSLTRSLWHRSNRELLDNGHEQGHAIQVKRAVEGLTAELHPGAERYYREVAILEPVDF